MGMIEYTNQCWLSIKSKRNSSSSTCGTHARHRSKHRPYSISRRLNISRYPRSLQTSHMHYSGRGTGISLVHYQGGTTMGVHKLASCYVRAGSSSNRRRRHHHHHHHHTQSGHPAPWHSCPLSYRYQVVGIAFRSNEEIFARETRGTEIGEGYSRGVWCTVVKFYGSDALDVCKYGGLMQVASEHLTHEPPRGFRIQINTYV